MGELTTQQGTNIFREVAKQWGVSEIDDGKLLNMLKATAFKPVKSAGGFIQATNEQLMALMIVAKQYNLNPILKELYAFPAKDGSIVPVVGVDGWARIINSHPQLDGVEFNYSDNIIEMQGAKSCPEWIECVIHRKDRKVPISVREYLDECYKPSKYSSPWQTHTKRFLRHKSFIQAVRIAFGFTGIYDQDEATNIVNSDRKEKTIKATEVDLNAEFLDIMSEPEKEVVHERQEMTIEKFLEVLEIAPTIELLDKHLDDSFDFLNSLSEDEQDLIKIKIEEKQKELSD